MERLTASETATPTLPIRIAAAASVAAHLALLALVVSAGVYPYDQAGSQAILAEIVTPDAAPPPPQVAAQQDQQSLAPPEPQAPAEPPPQQQQAAAPPPEAARQQAPQAEQQPPSPAPAAPAQAPPETPPWPPMGAQAPDITERYQVMLGLPSTELPPEPAETGGGEAAESAKIARSDVDKLRAHLRRCATLPGGVARSDKVRIVMRIALTPDGRLASPPALIEASASTKGPALMQAASKALQDCQPYAMLPREKYREWRVLDLSFTPADFNG
ncbi:MAG: hypothetical protein EWM45_15845 [Rhodopseudomonas palustris]|nr:MAG: hypothetical protein EWM45_15845 [Rhodopseudomonas palustris]